LSGLGKACPRWPGIIALGANTKDGGPSFLRDMSRAHGRKLRTVAYRRDPALPAR
jgi:hypothetical protein